MKAVVWADTLQMLIMFAGQLAILVQVSTRMGGLGEVFRIAQEGGRINLYEWVTGN